MQAFAAGSDESRRVGIENGIDEILGNGLVLGAGRFAGGGDENAGGAIGPFEVSGDVVLDFDVMEAAELAKAAHPRRHSAEPDEQVDIVRALVEQDAAAFAAPGRAPAATGVVS